MTPTALISIRDGQRCVGFVIARGKLGFEGFDRDQRSIGFYPSTQDAARAITEVSS
jgi:hypothetical protein